MSNLISDVYLGKNRIPVDFQAVKSFFLDHETVDGGDHWIKNNSSQHLKSLYYFKKPTDGTRDLISIDERININDYIRTANSLRKMGEVRPAKINKLIRLIQHMNVCKKKYAILIIKEMEIQDLIKIKDDLVLYG